MEDILLPGQERCTENENGVRYEYRNAHGEYFSCTADSLEAAQAKCEYWLLQRDRHTGL